MNVCGDAVRIVFFCAFLKFRLERSFILASVRGCAIFFEIDVPDRQVLIFTLLALLDAACLLEMRNFLNLAC